MSMGQLGGTTPNIQTGLARPGQQAGMTPSAGGKTLPGQMPGRPPTNQLQQAMSPTTAGGPQGPGAPSLLQGQMMPGMGPVAPQAAPQQNIAFENRAQNQGYGSKPGLAPVAPNLGSHGTGLSLSPDQMTAFKNQISARNTNRSAVYGR